MSAHVRSGAACAARVCAVRGAAGVQTIKPMGLFSLAQLIQTVRQRVKADGTDTTKTSINTKRGAKS